VSCCRSLKTLFTAQLLLGCIVMFTQFSISGQNKEKSLTSKYHYIHIKSTLYSPLTQLMKYYCSIMTRNNFKDTVPTLTPTVSPICCTVYIRIQCTYDFMKFLILHLSACWYSMTIPRPPVTLTLISMICMQADCAIVQAVSCRFPHRRGPLSIPGLSKWDLW
jgi:hypothetical protein